MPAQVMMRRVLATAMLAAACRAFSTVARPGTSVSTGAWLPVVSKRAVSNAKGGPIKVDIADDSYAVWQDGAGKWAVTLDACPHRLAPLSEGHVEESTGCLTCPYHGWQFDGSGMCTAVPQSPDDAVTARASAATALPTAEVGDLVWAFFPTEVGTRVDAAAATAAPDYPTGVSPRLEHVCGAYVRELPYSVDFLIENFLDPAHIPFAHHGKQGSRSDGSPIPMDVTLRNATHLEMTFKDVVRGRPRDGIASFVMPCHYSFLQRFTDGTGEAVGEYKTGLYMLCVPVSAAKSRLFICSFSDQPSVFEKFPVWIAHCFSNSFLDTDAWLQDAERRAGQGYRYHQLTSSDLGTSVWRDFWRDNLKHKPVFGSNGKHALAVPRQEKEEYLNWYESHVKHCSQCTNALSRARAIEKWSIAAAIAPLVLGLDLPLRAFGFATFVVARAVSGKVASALGGDGAR